MCVAVYLWSSRWVLGTLIQAVRVRNNSFYLLSHLLGSFFLMQGGTWGILLYFPLSTGISGIGHSAWLYRDHNIHLYKPMTIHVVPASQIYSHCRHLVQTPVLDPCLGLACLKEVSISYRHRGSVYWQRLEYCQETALALWFFLSHLMGPETWM